MMAERHATPLPEPGLLRTLPAPHWHGLPGAQVITLTFVMAVAFILANSLMLHGWATLRLTALCVTTALLLDATFHVLMRRSHSWSESYSLMIGMLTACTMPPLIGWKAPVMATALAVFIGQIVLGGIGNHPWHPVAIGRVLVQWIMPDAFTKTLWPVLVPDHLLWGDLNRHTELQPPAGWSTMAPPANEEAWLRTPTLEHLREPIAMKSGGLGETLGEFVRDRLPPWTETLIGTSGGAIGEAMIVAILLAGTLLMWRGILRGSMVAGAVVAFLMLACVLPVRVETATGIQHAWLPGAHFYQGWPIGLVYVFYQLTAGGFLFVVLILAADPCSSPYTARGQAVFGILIGAGTITLRCLVGMPGEAFWALLIANTMVPAINRMTKRRVFGT